MSERRIADRERVNITTYLRKTMPDGKYALMEFRSINLSPGGIFISTEDLGMLDLDEEVEIMVSASAPALSAETDSSFYEGRARVVRSARVFDSAQLLTDSGFGLMFLDSDAAFQAAVEAHLRAEQNGGGSNPAAS